MTSAVACFLIEPSPHNRSLGLEFFRKTLILKLVFLENKLK